MTTKIKKIIAREGLVIIGVAVLILVCFHLQSMFPYTSTDIYPAKYLYKVSIGGKSWKYRNSLDDPDISVTTKWELFQTARRDNPKDFQHYGVINNAGFIPKDFLVEYGGRIEKVLTEREKTNNKLNEFTGSLLIFVIVCVYPLYLLIRFIIWAVRTLKTK